MTLTERLVHSIGSKPKQPKASRRGFLGGAALVGAALAVDPWGYLVRPANAYDAVCGTEAACADGYSVFCCTINGGSNTCPPNSFIGGWWKADNSSFCGGSARYYIDCNAYRNGAWQCRCAEGTCDQRRVACNQFRYGQCSLDVPASNTGPVVCRMVSCTPPWQQFGGTCTSSSATDNRTATHAAPCLYAHAPMGSVDVVAADGGSIRVLGWAYDPDQPSTEIKVAVYVDGNGISWFDTGKSRNDVNNAFGISGNHGFDISIPVAGGTHKVDVFAINVGSDMPNPLLGGGTVNVGRTPIGALDSLFGAPDSKIRIRGWAFDPDEPATEIKVAVYRDNVGVAWFSTGGSRPDVNSAFGVSGNHGFDILVDSPPGDHTIQVFAINVAGGSGNPLVGAGGVRVGIPMGNLDRVTSPGGGEVRFLGWAYDPDQPNTEISVAVYRTDTSSGVTTGIGWFDTGRPRGDVNSVFQVAGNHGFDFPLPSATPPGTYRFDVYAINVGPSAGNPLIGRSTVRVS